MKTIVIDIINHKVLKLLKELESLKLIRLNKEKQIAHSSVDWINKYKGSMTKQPLKDIDNQFDQLRKEWE